MKTKLIIDGNSFYEIDENCVKKDENEKKRNKNKKEDGRQDSLSNFLSKSKKSNF
jgi:hypothetical protein